MLARLITFLVISSLACCSSPATGKGGIELPGISAQNAFTEMKSYVGSWERIGMPRDDFRILFSLTANQTVLLETWMRGNEVHSLTVYHIDDNRLVMTHYCPQGNQPRLVFEGRDKQRGLSFRFLDGTNLTASGNPYQSAATFALSESGSSMVRGEVYIHEGEDAPSSIRLQRFE